MSREMKTPTPRQLATLVATIMAGLSEAKLRRRPRSRHVNVLCRVSQVITTYNDDDRHEQELWCQPVSDGYHDADSDLEGMMLPIDFPAEFVAHHYGSWMQGPLVQVQGGQLSYHHTGTPATRLVATNAAAKLTILPAVTPNEGRHLQQASNGGKKLMLVRVSSADQNVTVSDADILGSMYGVDGRAFSLRAQFEKCSHNSLLFNPHDLQDPIVHVTVPLPSANHTRQSIFQAANQQVQNVLGSKPHSLADHVIFCLPPGLSGPSFKASAPSNSWFVLANNEWCRNPGALMHEIGHNLGLGHAGEGDSVYGDMTSLMGFGSTRSDGPTKCFNGHNVWQLGWYANQLVVLTPSSNAPPQLAQLAALTDVQHSTSSQAMVISVQSAASATYDLYLIYNRAEFFNAETGEYQDMVTVVKPNGSGGTVLVGVLNMENNQVFQQPDAVGVLTLQACSRAYASEAQADYFAIAVGYNDDTPCTSDPNYVEPVPIAAFTLAPTTTPALITVTTPTPAPTLRGGGTVDERSPTASVPVELPTPHAPDKEVPDEPAAPPDTAGLDEDDNDDFVLEDGDSADGGAFGTDSKDSTNDGSGVTTDSAFASDVQEHMTLLLAVMGGGAAVAFACLVGLTIFMFRRRNQTKEESRGDFDASYYY